MVHQQKSKKDISPFYVLLEVQVGLFSRRLFIFFKLYFKVILIY